MNVFQIRQNFKSDPNLAGFVKKGRISAGAQAKLPYSPINNQYNLTMIGQIVREFIIKSRSSSFLIHRSKRFTPAMASCFDASGLNTA